MSDKHSTPAKNVAEAIVRVMEEVGYVQKERTPNLNYSFAGEAALIAALRPAMVAEGLFLAIKSYEVVTEEPFTTRSGAVMNHAVIKGKVAFVHSVSQTEFTVEAFGEGMDTGDKVFNKAMTGCLKYALRQTFLIETGDDPDKERPEELAPKAKPDPKPKDWPGDVVDRVMKVWVEAGVIPPDSHAKHVIMLLNLLDLPVSVDDATLVRTGKFYRGARDAGLTTKDAAEQTRTMELAVSREQL